MRVVQVAVEVAVAVAHLLDPGEIRDEILQAAGTPARNRDIAVGKSEVGEHRTTGRSVDHAPLGRPAANLTAIGIGDLDTPVVGKAATALAWPDEYVEKVVKARPLINLEG